MIKIILLSVVVFIVTFITVFVICSAILAGRADREIEEYYENQADRSEK